MKIKGIIFDLDGVLVSTDYFHFLAWQKIAEEEGINFTREDNEHLRGVSRMDSLKIVLSKSTKHYSYEDLEYLCDKKNKIYREYLSTMTAVDVKPKYRQCLEKLKKDKYLLGLGSVSKNAEYILERTDLTKYFDVIGDGNKIVNSKPDPEIFFYVASNLGLLPMECLVIEDGKAGLKAAKSGGFISVGFNTSEPYKEADYLIQDLSEIEDIIEKENSK